MVALINAIIIKTRRAAVYMKYGSPEFSVIHVERNDNRVMSVHRRGGTVSFISPLADKSRVRRDDDDVGGMMETSRADLPLPS